MTTPIGLAVIGAGYWGPNLVRNAMATPALELRWLCDLDEDLARRVLGPFSTVSARPHPPPLRPRPRGPSRAAQPDRHACGPPLPAGDPGARSRQARARRE